MGLPIPDFFYNDDANWAYNYLYQPYSDFAAKRGKEALVITYAAYWKELKDLLEVI